MSSCDNRPFTYTVPEDEALSHGVVRAVAEATDKDPLDLHPPLSTNTGCQ